MPISRFSLLILGLAMGPLGPLQADSGPPGQVPTWEEIASLNAAGKYDEALRALARAPQSSATYYYNVGTLHYQLGRFGPSVAYLEKARRMDPFDLEVRKNLSLSRAQLQKVVGSERLDPAGNWLSGLSDELPLEQIRALVGLAALLLAWTWILEYRKSSRLRPTFRSPLSVVGIVALSAALILLGVSRWGDMSHPATFLEPSSVRSGPGPSYLELSRMDAGTKIRVIGSRSVAEETWLQIRYSSSDVGWAPGKSLLLL